MLHIIFAMLLSAADEPLVVDRPGSEITTSGRVAIKPELLPDPNGLGAIVVRGDGLTLDFAGAALRGAPVDAPGDTLCGTGLRITGRNVTIRRLKVSGYKCGIHADQADGLTLEGCDVSGNFRQHLRSTPRAEDQADWLWPHKNDGHEWLSNYGAGLYIERSRGVTVRECVARRGQNGLILDRVTGARIYDNDFSFLSGWGLALWRSSGNLISRNAFDFCVRGYSHGVYNRGQDSAGILMFEQCCDNVIAENSATHGGDGFFGFAGREALGETWMDRERQRIREKLGPDGIARERERLASEKKDGPQSRPAAPDRANVDWSKAGDDQVIDALIVVPSEVVEQHRRRGNTGNILLANDFSYAPAHGIEMTFSFQNLFLGNRLIGNAICGVWGGYSQDTTIEGNDFETNGESGYGLERGGVNIEHGRNNRIVENRFRKNRCGVHLWASDGSALARTPWGLANGTTSTGNSVLHNEFNGDELALQFRGRSDVTVGLNSFEGVGTQMAAASEVVVSEPAAEGAVFSALNMLKATPPDLAGESRPVGARPDLRGREKIIITEWGPYDWKEPYLQFLGQKDATHVYRLLGTAPPTSAFVRGSTVAASQPAADAAPRPLDPTPDAATRLPRFVITPPAPDAVYPYELSVKVGERTLAQRGTLVAATWSVRVFPWKTDPREDYETWKREADGGASFTAPQLDLRFGMRGPSDLPGVPKEVADAKLPRDRFGTIATTRLTIPAGKWKLSTTSDDGVRVWVDDRRVLDNWTWHGPTVDTVELDFTESRTVEIRVEHFELDGFAVLALELGAL